METILLFIAILLSGMVSFKFGKLKQEAENLRETVDKINTANTLDNISDDDINKLHDKYE